MHYCFVHFCNMPIQSTMFPWSLTRRHGRGRTGGTRCYSGSNSKHSKCSFLKDTLKCGSKMYFTGSAPISKGNYILGVWIWYLYSILKASWSFLRVTDKYKQNMISGSKKAPQIGRARSRANSLTQLFESIAWPDVFVFSSMISYDHHKICAILWGELFRRIIEARTRIIFILFHQKKSYLSYITSILLIDVVHKKIKATFSNFIYFCSWPTYFKQLFGISVKCYE